MQACEEATQLIMSLTAQVAQLKQMTSVEHISRQQIISTGEDILQAWIKGEKHSPVLHARWKEATDPKAIDKKFKQIAKEYEAKLAEVEKAKGVIAQHEKDQADPKMPTVKEPIGPQEVPSDIPAIAQPTPKKGKGK
jgi:membrane-bound lytic murein transglycosylase B